MAFLCVFAPLRELVLFSSQAFRVEQDFGTSLPRISRVKLRAELATKLNSPSRDIERQKNFP